MNMSMGKYSGPLAALLEHWLNGGDHGQEEATNMGEGTILYRDPGPLTWDDAKVLRDEFACTDEDLDLLSIALTAADSAVLMWDSHGFLDAWTNNPQQTQMTISGIRSYNAELAEAEAGE